MYRSLLMFPVSADPDRVVDLIDAVTAHVSARDGFLSLTRSVGALMGPGAKRSDVGWILEIDHASLDDVMSALEADGFAEVRAAVEDMGTSIFLFEVAES